MKIKGGKGQVSVFIIIALVVIAGIGAAVYISKANRDFFNQPNIKPQVVNTQDFILDCMDETTKDALEVIGIQGGYYNEPEHFFDLGWAFIPYYYKEGLFLMPEKKTIESELSSYVNENFVYCLGNFDFADFNLDYKIPKTRTSIKKGEVLFEINLPISIEREGKRIKFETKIHPVTQASYLYEILEIASYITDSHKEDPEMICVNCVAEMASERNVYVDMLDFADETTTLIVISENSTAPEPYIFEFLNKYPVE